jgi:major membrane immunogen (membrane-anchored lipoprotein)
MERLKSVRWLLMLCPLVICLVGCGEDDTELPQVRFKNLTNHSNVTKGRELKIEIDATDNIGVTEVEFFINGEKLDSKTSAPWEFTWNTENLQEGDYKLSAKAFDDTGNDMDATITVKLIDPPPTITVTEPQNNSCRGKGEDIQVIVNTTDNLGVARVEFYVDGQLRETDTDAPWHYLWKTEPDKEGKHVVTAKAYDTGGKSTATSVTVGLDSTPPQVSMQLVGKNDTVCKGEKVPIKIDAHDKHCKVIRVELLVNGQVHDTDENSPWQAVWNPAEFAGGTHHLSVRASDAAGNVATTPENRVQLIEDVEPPTVQITNLQNDSIVFRNRETVAFTAHDNCGAVSNAEFFVDGRPLGINRNPPWGFIWKAGDFPDGDYQLTVKASDAFGNVGESAPITVKVRDVVCITEIRVVNVPPDAIFNPQFEIEVHIYDTHGRFIGCSGADSGLRKVDVNNKLFRVQAYFQKSFRSDDVVTFEEVKDREIYFRVIEDDSDACPVKDRVGPDELVGHGETFIFSELNLPHVFRFAGVPHLKITKARK